MVIYRVVIKEKVPADATHNFLCEKLLTYIDNICIDSPEYIAYRKAGVVPRPGNIGVETCKTLKSKLIPMRRLSIMRFPVSFAFYNAPLPDVYKMSEQYGMIVDFFTKGVFNDLTSNRTDWGFYMDYYGRQSKKDDLLRQSINFNLDNSRNVEYLSRRFTEQFFEDRERADEPLPDTWFTDAHIKLIMYLHQGFRTGQLPLDIQWEDLCESDYVKKFTL